MKVVFLSAAEILMMHLTVSDAAECFLQYRGKLSCSTKLRPIRAKGKGTDGFNGRHYEVFKRQK